VVAYQPPWLPLNAVKAAGTRFCEFKPLFSGNIVPPDRILSNRLTMESDSKNIGPGIRTATIDSAVLLIFISSACYGISFT